MASLKAPIRYMSYMRQFPLFVEKDILQWDVNVKHYLQLLKHCILEDCLHVFVVFL